MEKLLKNITIENSSIKKDHDTIFLIYTMGRVGTGTVSKSIQKALPNAYVFHVHNFLKYHTLINDEIYHAMMKRHDDALMTIKKFPEKKIKVITLVRDPIARMRTAIFVTWKNRFGENSTLSSSELFNYINEHSFKHVFSWFDTEFKQFLNFDIFSKEFDKKKGYSIYNYENKEILCMQLERLNDIGKNVLEDFIGTTLELTIANKTEERPEAMNNNDLKENFKVSKETINRVYQSKFSQHFYSEKDIIFFSDKWLIDSHKNTYFNAVYCQENDELMKKQQVFKKLKDNFLKVFKPNLNKMAILVYTPAKVGTIAIRNAIQTSFPEIEVEFGHMLAKPKEAFRHESGLRRQEKALNFIKQNSNKRLKLVTLVRDPIVREMSHIFHNKELIPKLKALTEDLPGCVEYLNQHHFGNYLNWFDKELKVFFGFDIYNYSFDKEKGYQIYTHGNIDILCIKLEKLTDIDKEAFNKFIGRSLKTQKEHTTNETSYAADYNELKNIYKINDKTIKRVYNSKLVQHFYTKKEVEFFIKKWS